MQVRFHGASLRWKTAATFNWAEDSLLPFSLSEGRTERESLRQTKQEALWLSELRYFNSSRFDSSSGGKAALKASFDQV